MRERPIVFTGDSVRAILAGRKTQSRRVMKPQPEHLQVHQHRGRVVYEGEHRMWCWRDLVLENLVDFPAGEDRRLLAARCPYGAAGARLWVRETWAGMDAFAFVGAHDVEPPQCVGYRADESALIWSDANRPPKPADTTGWNWESPRIRWRSPIHMPRWASRLTLEITSVRVERVQAITPLDAVAEGVFGEGRYATCPPLPYPVATFAALWDAINGKCPGCSWAASPWVWALEFRRVEAT